MSKKAVFIVLIGLIFLTFFIYLYHKKGLILGITSKNEYTLVFVGDSMTQYLGNFDELRQSLKEYYPQKTFQLLNYGFGSTNILSLQDRIEKETTYSGRIFKPINDINFDFIFIESFGHNPLSEFSLDEGLKKQNEALDKAILALTPKHPRSSIIFVSTIAPNKNKFAEGILNLLPEEKESWVKEREYYLKNHIEYANSHKIKLVNIYEKSLGNNGTGNLDYINSNDFIHPSPTGIHFISKEIAKFIHNNLLK